MADANTLKEYLKVIKDNPFNGTTNQIVNLSFGISNAKKKLDTSIFNIFKEKSGIEAKTFSKLKKIGDKLNLLNERDLKEVVKGLPPSYNIIHSLMSLNADAIITSVKSKSVSPSTSYREVNDYVKKVKFPHLMAKDGEKGRWSTKQEHLWSVFRTDDVRLEGQAFMDVEIALRRVLSDYGLSLRDVRNTNKSTIRKEERRVKAQFWRKILEEEVTQRWFSEQADELKKQFNLKTVDELRDTPLRQFTGFLVKADSNKGNFWEKHGQAYIAKVNFLMETTEDNAQRYNYKRSIERRTAEFRDLAVFNTLMLKRGGFN